MGPRLDGVEAGDVDKGLDQEPLMPELLQSGLYLNLLPQARTSGCAQQHPSAETGGTLRGVILGKTQLNPAQCPREQVGLGGAAGRRVAGEGQGDSLSGFWSL